MKKTLAAVVAALACAVGLLGAGAVPAEAAPAAQLRIMPVGDSITWGVGSATNSSYRAPLWTTITGAGYTLDFVGSQRSGSLPDPDNEGHSGWKINDIAGVATQRLATYQPNIVLVQIGTNDINGNDNVASAPDRLGKLIDQIFTAAPNAAVVVSKIILTSSASTNTRIDAFNNALPAIVTARANAGKHVILISQSPLTAADMYDGLHPNDSGYKKMAASFWGGIQTVLSNGWVPGVAGGGSGPTPTPTPTSTPTPTPTPTATTGPGAGTGPLKGQESKRCLDVSGGSTAAGARIQLWDCNGGTNQSFTVTASKQLMVYGNKCLDGAGRGTANGTLVQIWDCNGQTNQQWTLNSDGTIVGVGSGKCLDAIADGTANGTPVKLWTCHNGANQKFARS